MASGIPTLSQIKAAKMRYAKSIFEGYDTDTALLDA